jgi:threonine aldolase
VPDPVPEGARLVCSWATGAAEVDALLAVLRGEVQGRSPVGQP